MDSTLFDFAVIAITRNQRYEIRPSDDEVALTKRILELACEHPRYGYRFITAKLRHEGWQVIANACIDCGVAKG